jgi:hypothetical protein
MSFFKIKSLLFIFYLQNIHKFIFFLRTQYIWTPIHSNLSSFPLCCKIPLQSRVSSSKFHRRIGRVRDVCLAPVKMISKNVRWAFGGLKKVPTLFRLELIRYCSSISQSLFILFDLLFSSHFKN